MDQRLRAIEAEIPRLRRYARYLTRDSERADDLVQEGLVRAISRLHTWQPGTNLRAWLFVILGNQHISEVRRDRREFTTEPVAEDHSEVGVAGMQISQVEMGELRDAFRRLSEDHRHVLQLVVIEGLTYEEAAAVLDLPVGTVRSRLSRARAALRVGLNGEAPDLGRHMSGVEAR